MANAMFTLSDDQIHWLRELAIMAAPITCPGEEVRFYQELKDLGLAQHGPHVAWGDGWTVTEDGRRAALYVGLRGDHEAFARLTFPRDRLHPDAAVAGRGTIEGTTLTVVSGIVTFREGC